MIRSRLVEDEIQLLFDHMFSFCFKGVASSKLKKCHQNMDLLVEKYSTDKL
jgi:hypothetical protein